MNEIYCTRIYTYHHGIEVIETWYTVELNEDGTVQTIRDQAANLWSWDDNLKHWVQWK